MKRLRFVFVLALAAAAAVGVQVAVGSIHGDGHSSSAALPSGGRAALEGVNFVSVCRFSHRNQDDMIVAPGQPGKSTHDHTYVGNTTTNANSTLASLLSADTTCERSGDTAAYWVPTLLDPDGNAVEPLGATIYYRRHTLAPIVPFPSGLRMIAGDAKAASPQARRITSWSCGSQSDVPTSSEMPVCPVGQGLGLRLHVRFPDCWDGRSLDSANHQSHMAYSMNGRCPRTHPLAVPAVALIVRYGVSGGDGYVLASGGVYSAHADFVNAWQQTALRRLVGFCLNGLRHCGRGI